ncbi:MAG: hypothetical protein O3A36_02650 [bacterium]|nr:hypothetical protein [bacterium]
MSFVTPIAPKSTGQIISTEVADSISHAPSKNVTAIKIVNTGIALWWGQLQLPQFPEHVPDPHD